MTKKATSEAQAEDINAVSTSEVGADTLALTLDEYLKTVAVHPGLVASFRCEGAADSALLEPKTTFEWELAFTDQSLKVYE